MTIETGTTDGERKPISVHRREIDFSILGKASLTDYYQKFLI